MKQLLYSILSLLLLFSCVEKPLDPMKPVYVKIKTTMGDVTVLLFDDTPLHRDNFIRLCQSGSYNEVLFHRVIKDFVVQGGDPTSKDQEPGKLYGEDYGGYTVPAEILPHHFHKRGALMDARKGDEINPERASGGTHFCFVQGRVYTDDELDDIEKRLNSTRWNWLYYKFKDQLNKENAELAIDELDLQASIQVADTLDILEPLIIPENHREVYKTIGGIPFLDTAYTVFGEIIEGLDIVEKMSLVETDRYDRPVKDIIIKSTKVFQK